MFKHITKLIGLLALGTAVFMIAVPSQATITSKPVVVKAKKVKKPVKKAASPKDAQKQANESGKDKFKVK